MERVLSVGIATVDTVVLVEKYPAANERVISLETIRSVGGPATTAAVTMARLGIDVSLASVVGDDEAGRFILQKMESEGVNIDHVTINPEISTAIGTIIVSKSEASRAIMVQPHTYLPQKPVNIHDYSMIHLDQFGIEALRKWGIKRGGLQKISVDIGYPTPGFKSGDFDIYAPSENITTDISTAIQDKNWVVISCGGEGSIYSDGESSGKVPAITGEILSTLGAGDVFHGALVASAIWGKSIVEAVEIANLVAGISCRALDGQSGIPTKAELDAYMAKVRS